MAGGFIAAFLSGPNHSIMHRQVDHSVAFVNPLVELNFNDIAHIIEEIPIKGPVIGGDFVVRTGHTGSQPEQQGAAMINHYITIKWRTTPGRSKWEAVGASPITPGRSRWAEQPAPRAQRTLRQHHHQCPRRARRG